MFFFWVWLMGPVGALLSMPITVLIVLVLNHNERTRWVAALLSRNLPTGTSDGGAAAGRPRAGVAARARDAGQIEGFILTHVPIARRVVVSLMQTGGGRSGAVNTLFLRHLDASNGSSEDPVDATQGNGFAQVDDPPEQDLVTAGIRRLWSAVSSPSPGA